MKINYRNIKRLSYLLIFLCLACSKEIDIEQVHYQQQLVVDGWIENGQKAKVLLTMSSPFLNDYDSASIRNTFVNYAKVTVSNDLGESEILTLKRQDDFFPPFMYQSIVMRGEPGRQYYLEVKYRNKIVTASTSIPELPNINQVELQTVSDTSMVINANIDDPGGQSNYYYTQIRTKHFDTRYHPSGNPLLNDRLFDGKSHSYQVKRSNQPDPLNIYSIDSDRNLKHDEFAMNDTVLVKISQIDKAAFEVLNGIYIDHLSSGSPFSLVDQKTATNIIGGIGQWTGLASKNYLIYHSNE